MGHLMIGGLLIYIIPYYRLTPDICRILGENFDDLTAWRVTDGEFKKFKQAVILGLRKKRTDDPDAGIPLERYADPAALQCVTQLEERRYAVPAVHKRVEIFKGERFNERELERQLSQSDSIRRLMNARSSLDRADKRPLLPLSIGQIGLVGRLRHDQRSDRLRHPPYHQGAHHQGQDRGAQGDVQQSRHPRRR